jgi:hypothetical protein
MTNYKEMFIKDLAHDSLILVLLKEIAHATQFPLEPHQNRSMVIHYLKDYRVRRPITKESIDAVDPFNTFHLRKQIKKLHGTEIYFLCDEIAHFRGTGVERIAGHTLYSFLDQYLKDGKKKKKRPLPGYLVP